MKVTGYITTKTCGAEADGRAFEQGPSGLGQSEREVRLEKAVGSYEHHVRRERNGFMREYTLCVLQ